MPTHGQWYFNCIPNSQGGTCTTHDDIGHTKHVKGIYFDYRIVGKAGVDSVLWAEVQLLDVHRGGNTKWIKTIHETPRSFGGLPSITIQKKDEYMELPYSESNGGMFFIYTNGGTGTFTFEIDNIRMVPR